MPNSCSYALEHVARTSILETGSGPIMSSSISSYSGSASTGSTDAMVVLEKESDASHICHSPRRPTQCTRPSYLARGSQHSFSLLVQPWGVRSSPRPIHAQSKLVGEYKQPDKHHYWVRNAGPTQCICHDGLVFGQFFYLVLCGYDTLWPRSCKAFLR